MTFQERYKYSPETDLLGKGGFARVYKAKDVLLDRDVAIKIFNVNDQHQYTVVEEIKKVIKLKHPNLLSYYDVAIIEHTTPLGEKEAIQIGVMELANAGDLKQFAKNNPGSPLLFKLLQQVLSGLEYLHGKNIIHRDLKPQNILLVDEDGELTAKISDFGISKSMDSGTNSSSMAIGTIEYMAPEQFSPAKYGINGKIGTNIDLWSFGIMVHELLTNEPLFGQRSGNTTAEQIMSAILSSEIPEGIDSLPEPYRSTVKKCLVKDANARVQKAKELIGILEGKEYTPIAPDYTETMILPKQTATETIVFNKPGEQKPVYKPQPPTEVKQGSKKWVLPLIVIALLVIIAGLWWVTKDKTNGSGIAKQNDSLQNSIKYWDSLSKIYPVAIISTLKQIDTEMVTIPGGSFSMGSNEGEAWEKPVHPVIISSFKMAKYELTVKEFAAFIDAAKYKTDAEKTGSSYVFTGEWKEMKGVSWRDDEEGHRRNESEWNKPVIHVSWNDAIAYCQWLSGLTGKKYRLPTEAEWEYGAGSGAKHYKYSWGNNLPGSSDKVANIADETTHPKYGSWTKKLKGYNDGYYFAAPVGSFTANELGLYDMSGNVWEWCNDWFDDKYYANSVGNDPQGAEKGQDRVIRGGGWNYGPAFSLVAYRNLITPDRRYFNLGFRLALSL